VVADDDPLPRENVHTSAGFLESIIRYYRSRRIPLLSLSEALIKLENPSGERFVSFTLDDGYRDNLRVALPIFRKYGVPFTIYVTSAFLDRRLDDYHWGQLRHLVMDNAIIEIDPVNRRLVTRTRVEKRRAYDKLMRWMGDGTLDAKARDALFAKYRVTVSAALDRDAMTAAELAAAVRTEPLIEIGGHTKTHARLTALDDVSAAADISQNKAELEAIIDREVRHFAFPFGDPTSCDAREFQLANAAGFASAVTTRIGNLFAEHLRHPWCLPRLRFLGPCESLGFMESQRSGAVTALTKRFGDPVVLR
jgi:peptidoglycan/xylan/chitin deacetylase (PgdA/CDA1 family)